MAESNQKKLSRVRKPRVHITYDVETEGAEEKVELPFVVGVMGDFSGDPTTKLDPMHKRKFTQVDRDNFNDVMKSMNAGLNMRVENTMEGDGSEIGVNLEFNSLEDFSPASVAKQVEPLAKLMETRNQLRDLLTKVDRSEELETLLADILKKEDQLKALASELGVEGEGE
ncbi:MAG: type VI secretion system protein ImpB [Pirellulaceae bacterium]|jgi:type VI secretion system protein ImpB